MTDRTLGAVIIASASFLWLASIAGLVFRWDAILAALT